ncbi:phosphoethanolamine transferase [Oxalicibacterium faecigallinarum]|nr:phosphoethanolamine--lipid A transferase [Oxalicibacterium faecigallinarum]
MASWLNTPIGLIVVISIWLATIANFPLWRTLTLMPDNHGSQYWIFIFSFSIIIASLNAIALGVLAWGVFLKPVLALSTVAAGFGGYFMLTYGIVIDTGMIRNVIQTDVREVKDLLDIRLPITLLLLSGPPLVIIWFANIRPRTIKLALLQQIGIILGALALLVAVLLMAYQPFSSTMRNHPQVRYLINPLNSFYALTKLGVEPLINSPKEFKTLGEDVRLSELKKEEQPPIMILIVGETVRAQNLSLNSYQRTTTPLLSQEKNLFSAENAWSCGTSTAESIPCMFSNLGREGYLSRKADYENLLDVIQRAGMAVLWLDNQSGCKGVCERIPTQQAIPNPSSKFCTQDGTCQDSFMLENLKERIDTLPADRRKHGIVLVMHQMGSHGPAYFKRSMPERKKFLPECKSANLQSCSRESVMNAYDNSILETDYFLKNVIKWLDTTYKDRATSMMYVSDHGESLGEGNIYLHGLPYVFAPETQKKIPWILWMSDKMQDQTGASIACLNQRKEDALISHDNYFHTVIGMLNAQTHTYRRELDLLSACRQ